MIEQLAGNAQRQQKQAENDKFYGGRGLHGGSVCVNAPRYRIPPPARKASEGTTGDCPELCACWPYEGKNASEELSRDAIAVT